MQAENIDRLLELANRIERGEPSNLQPADAGLIRIMASVLNLLDKTEPDDWFEDVFRFRAAMGLHIGLEGPKMLDGKQLWLSCRTMAEEFTEFLTAVGMPPSESLVALLPPPEEQGPTDLAEAVDALIDLQYYSLGVLINMGVDARPIWRVIQAANMAKLGGPKDKDGKQLKPAGWKHPDIGALLEKQKPILMP